MSDVIVSGIYCDDIRSEIGGKQSYMGVYNSDLLVQDFPAQLEKLWIQVTVRLPLDTKAENLTVIVLKNDESIADIPLPEGQLQSMRAMVAAASLDGPLAGQSLGCHIALQFPNLQMSEPGVIRLRAIVDGVEVKGNALRIRQPNEVERSQSLAALQA